MWEDDAFSDPGVGPVVVPLAQNPVHKGGRDFNEMIEYVNEFEEKAVDLIKAWRKNYPPNAIDRKLTELERIIIKGGK